MDWAPVWWTLHILATAGLAIHSLNYLVLALTRARLPRPTAKENVLLQPTPRVVLQVPVRNEPDQLPGMVAAVALLEWPRDRIHVQLLDDSDDAVAGASAVATLQSQGLHVEHVMRANGTGAKAGALEHGRVLAQAFTPDLFVLLDCDFRPAPDLIRQLASGFDDPAVACVQARWSAQNATANLLTQAQDLAFDGHFLVEQRMRAEVGGLMSFNATACAWRASAIESLGGWPTATLTEDLDLSTRALVAGWRFRYLEGVAVPSEVPATASAFATQQARWARGSIQCLRRHARSVLRSDVVPGMRKPGVLFHLGHYSLYPLVLFLMAAQAGLTIVADAPRTYAWGTLAGLGAGPLALYAVASWKGHGVAGLARLWRMVPLAVVGLGLTPTLARAALAGLRTDPGPFLVTPKSGRRGAWVQHGLPASAAAAFVAGWAWIQRHDLADPLAPGVIAFGTCCAVVAVLR